MPQTLKLLIIEDNANDLQLYKDAIRNINQDFNGRFSIEAHFETTLEGGKEKLYELKEVLDGAFVDLKLTPGSAVDVNEGNEIIKEIYGKMHFPIVVLTNTPGGFDTKYERSLFLQVLTKADVQLEEVIRGLINIHQTGITKIFGEGGMLQKLINEIFWKHLSGSLGYWVNEKNEKTLLRYTLTHAIEYLEIENGKFLDYNPAEVYLNPPTKPFLFTGTILKENEGERNYIVLSPACDLSHAGKAKSIVLAVIEPLTISVVSDLKTLLNKQIPAGIEPQRYTEEYAKRENAKLSLENIFKNNFANKYHFLPPSAYFKGGLINFQYINTKAPEEIEKEFIPIALVTTSFCKDIIARFSYYYSRQGSPDFDFKSLLKKFINA